jgi:hypothetical protein
MIGRALIGAVAAAVAMFIVGFIFFATPINGIGMKSLPDPQAAAVQNALAQNLPETATYAVPSDATAGQTTLYGRGPIATIHYNTSGFAIGDPATMIGGFIHMLVVTLLMAVGLYTASRYIASARASWCSAWSALRLSSTCESRSGSTMTGRTSSTCSSPTASR